MNSASNDPPLDEHGTLSPSMAQGAREVCDQFEAAWNSGNRPRIEDYLGETLSPAHSIHLLRELIVLEVTYRQALGEQPRPEDYLGRFPALEAAWLDGVLVLRPTLGTRSMRLSSPVPRVPVQFEAHSIRCPHCRNPIRLIDDRPNEVLCPSCGSSFHVRDARGTASIEPMRPLGKFQLLERVGLGSFGAVWRARDSELDRIVALKILHTGDKSSPADLKKFYAEARSAAQLDHPNIVAVYEVIALEGMPAIVSKYIDGATLQDLLKVRRLTFREAAALLAEVADALEYAHNQGTGLVHRDIKPANIMIEYKRRLGPEDEGGNVDLKEVGRPLVVDFGLALRAEAAITLTLDGQIVGTPAYMSPEQAGGKGHLADRRSDVYSLGVVLYELICGELPFSGALKMLLLQVIHDEPKPPRHINDRIPRDLETICLKAMAKEPNRRYQTAGELARDLRRFLKGEPVHARPVGKAERLWRWCRRNPRVAGLAVTIFSLLVMLALGSTVAAIWIDRERRTAERNFDYSLATTNLLTQAALSTLEEVPRMEQWQKELLNSVVTFYKTLIDEKNTTPSVRQGKGQAYRHLGEILSKMGEEPEALESYTEAIALLAELAADYPKVPVYRHELAATHTDLGELLRTGNRQPDVAEAHYAEAIRLEEELKNKEDVVDYRRELARAHNNRGLLLQKNKARAAEAGKDHNQAISLLEEVANRPNTPPQLRAALAGIHQDRAIWHEDQRQYEKAEQDYSASILLLKPLVKPAGPRQYRFMLSLAYNNLSDLLRLTRGPPGERDRLQLDALSLLSELHRDFPQNPRYKASLANNLNNQGAARLQAGNVTEAKENFSKARELLQSLIKDFRDHPTHNYRLGLACYNLGFIELQGQKRDAPQRLATLTLPEVWTRPGVTLAGLGWQMLDRQRLNQAGDLLQEAVRYQKTALQRARDNSEFATGLHNSRYWLTETWLRLGEHHKAAREAWELHEFSPEDANRYLRPARFLARCVTLAEHEPSLAKEYGVKGAKLLEGAITKQFLTHEKVKADPAFRPLLPYLN